MRTVLKQNMTTRKLYRHLHEFETVFEDVPQVRIVWDDKTGKPVKAKKPRKN